MSPEEYEELVDLTGCQYGTVIKIQPALDRFGLGFVKEPVWPSFMGTKDLPCEINVWHKRYGSHSILAVDLCAKTEAVRLLNFDYLTTAEGWMFLEDLHHFECKNPNRREPRWSGRTIRLRESSGSGTVS